MQFVTPEGSERLEIPTVMHPSELEFDGNTFVLMCMKSHQTMSALETLALFAPRELHLTCVQNGVANERLALRYFPNTYATVVNLPALFLKPGEIVTYAEGIGGVLDTGRFPTGADAAAETITTDLTDAGFAAIPDPAVMRKKYAKLLMNLGNILQAGLSDPSSADGIGKALRSEALACFTAAGIDCASREQARARTRDMRMVAVPGYERTAGSSWQSLARGTGDIETDYLNGEICWLGRMHGVPTPFNDACVVLARELVRRNEGPGLFTADELEARALRIQEEQSA
jgi:2-dehydropantoate 2-reductase